MLMATDKIKLKYPKQPLLCSKKDFEQPATIILFNEYSENINAALAGSGLTQTQVTMLAHPGRRRLVSVSIRTSRFLSGYN